MKITKESWLQLALSVLSMILQRIMTELESNEPMDDRKIGQ